MFDSVQARGDDRGSAALVDIAPLIDVLFILLIFFLVTSTFVRDTGVEIERPAAIAATTVEPTSLRVSVTAGGSVYAQGDKVSLRELEHRVRRFVARERRHSVLIIPDGSVSATRLVEVMDAAKLGGARTLSVATRNRP